MPYVMKRMRRTEAAKYRPKIPRKIAINYIPRMSRSIGSSKAVRNKLFKTLLIKDGDVYSSLNLGIAQNILTNGLSI